jgi:hypothetical protein
MSKEELETQAAQHERNAQIIRASMGSKPDPNDSELLASALGEARKAEDCRALAARLTYCGVKCAHCRRFIVLRTYEVETHFSLSEPVMNFRCDACGQVCGYRQSDIAYSTSADGAQAQYPFR